MMTDSECEDFAAVRRSRIAVLSCNLGAMLVLMILSGCNEILGDLIDDADSGYCYGCDWIVQEWYDGWETRNSDPNDDEPACEQALAEQAARNRNTGFRCINEEELIDIRRGESRNRVVNNRQEFESCWACDWVLQEWRDGGWIVRDRETYDHQGLCEQALWYKSREFPDTDYRCAY